MAKGRWKALERQVDAALARAESLGGSNELAEAKAQLAKTGELPDENAPATVREYVERVAAFDAAMDGLHVEADPSEYDLTGLDVE